MNELRSRRTEMGQTLLVAELTSLRRVARQLAEVLLSVHLGQVDQTAVDVVNALRKHGAWEAEH